MRETVGSTLLRTLATTAALAASSGSSLVGFIQSGTGAVARTVQDKARERVSVKDFGAVGDGITDDTAAIQKAANHCASINGCLIFSAGNTYCISGTVLIQNGVREIAGNGSKIKLPSVTLTSGFTLDAVENCRVHGLSIDCAFNQSSAINCQNAVNCIIEKNVIYNLSNGFGIQVSCTSIATRSSSGNIISGNVIIGDGGLSPQNNGIQVHSFIDYSPYTNASDYWKANFSIPSPLYSCTNCIVEGNSIYGGYYAISLSGASNCSVVNNNASYNIRNISAQNGSNKNLISGNNLQESKSSGIHIAYGSSYNKIHGNTINSLRAEGQGILQAYVGATNNQFTENSVSTAPAYGPLWHIYCGVNSSSNVFSGNILRGGARRAYIAIESAWDNTVTNPASYGYGLDSSVNGFANSDITGVVISNNSVEPSLAVPAIFVSQIGTYAVKNCIISRNSITTNTASKQLELYEITSGKLSDVYMKGNAFNALADASKFTMPRGRLHFSYIGENSIFDDGQIGFTSGDTSPSVAVGGFFVHADAAPTSVTYYDDGVNGQEIVVRLSSNTTIIHNTSFIRLKGGANVVGSSVGGGNAILAFRRISSIWFEMWRNF